ncbi:MAG: hypothetical protein EBR28_03350 [Planctomycetia bacterium]|nr:hypothetical protein [Planctomycetia bacterium]
MLSFAGRAPRGILMRQSIMVAAACMALAPAAIAQTTASLTTTAYSQDFNAITTSSAATLPTGWMFASGTAPVWSGTGNTTATTKSAGLTGTGALTTSVSGGAYLFVDGILASGTDKAIGFLTSSSYTSPKSILFGFTNNTGGDVSSMTLGWNYEKYRNGSRAFDWKFYGSADGTTWTSFTGGDKSYVADATTATISSVVTSSVSPFAINSTITSGASYYLRWDYIGSGGSTNAQALAIDNFSLSLSGSVAPPPATTGLFWDTNGATAGVGGSGIWTTSGSTFATTIAGTAFGSLATAGTVTFAGTAGTVTVGGTVSPPGGLQFATTGYTLTGGTIALVGGASSTITTDSGVSTIVNSVLAQVSGTAAVVKAGAGSLALGGDNTYAGGTTINSGTLAATANSALGSGPVSVGNASLVAGSGVTLANAITVAASGTGATGSLIAGWDFQTAATGGTVIAAAPATPTVFQANFGAGTLYFDGSNGSSAWVTGTVGNELTAFGGTGTVNAGPGFSTTTTAGAVALIGGSASGATYAANGKSAVFTVDMTGKQNLVVSLAEQRTSTAFTTETWSYSTDGTTWTTFQTLGVTDIPQSFGLITLNSISGLNDLAKGYVKVTFDGATNSSGNVRLDNIQFNAAALGTEVTAFATLGTDVVGGAVEFSGPVTLGSSANVLAASGASVVFSGSIGGGGGIRKIGDGTVTIATDAAYGGGTTVEAGQLRLGAGGAAGSVAGGVQLLAAGSSLVIDRADDLTIANAVSGSGGLFKEGGNTVTLTGSSSYTGGTTLFAGTVVVGDGGTRGAIAATGPLDLSAGTVLAFDRSDDVRLSGAVTGDGTLAQRGLGTLALSQAGGLGNVAVRVEAGVVNLDRGGASLVGLLGAGNAVQLAGGTLELTGDSGENTKLTGVSITVEADSTLAINRSGAAGDHVTTGFNVPIAIGNGSTLTFDYRGAFSSSSLPVVRYKGTTTYTGTVALDGAASVGVTNSSGGTAEVVFAAPVVDGGNGYDLTKVGAERLTLAAANTYGGDTIVNEGTLALGAAGSIADSPLVAVAAGATFDVSARAAAYAVPGTQTIRGAGTVAGAIAVGSGATLEPGNGIGVLSVTQGVTWASGGDLNWQISDATGVAGTGWDLLDIGGSLDIAATSSAPFQINLWSLSSGSGTPASGAAAGFDATRDFTWKIATAAGGITGFAADRFQVNTAAFNGAGGFANGTAGGTFSVAKNGNEIDLVFTKAGGQAGPITFTVASGSTVTQSAVLTGTTPVVKSGAGTLVLGLANTLTGPTTVSQGTLQLGNAGALASSPVTVAAGATLTVGPQVAATVPSLANGGLVDVGLGTLTVAGGMTGDGVAAAIVAVLNGGTSGITSSAAAATPFRAVGWLDNGDGSVTFGFAAEGDTNLDGMVDVSDLQNILASGKYGSGVPAAWADGDFNFDGVVDVSDLQDILASGLYGQGGYNDAPLVRLAMVAGGGLVGTGTIAAVPEPSTWGLAAAGVLILMMRRRSRKHCCPWPGKSPQGGSIR